MIGVNTKVIDTTSKVIKAEEAARFKNFRHAAASIRKSIIEGVRVNKEVIGYITTNIRTKRGKRRRKKIYRPSPVGTPVYTHRSQGFVRRGVRFDADKEGAIIGFADSVYGDVMKVHEFGGVRFGQIFQPRPTVKPGLEDNLERFAGDWRGSIGE